MIRPREGAIRPATARSAVLLPAPDGPTSATGSPARYAESELEGEVAERDGEVERELAHPVTHFEDSRTAALATTSRAPSASAVSKSRADSA